MFVIHVFFILVLLSWHPAVSNPQCSDDVSEAIRYAQSFTQRRSQQLGYWSDLTISRADLFNVTQALRSEVTASYDRTGAVIAAVSAAGVADVYHSLVRARSQSQSTLRSEQSVTPAQSIIIATQHEGDHSRADPSQFYGRFPMQYAGMFIPPDPSAKRPTNDRPIIVYGPDADEGTAVHEFIHALFHKSRLECQRKQNNDPAHSCPADPRRPPRSIASSKDPSETTLDEDLEELEFRLSETLEELDTYTILATEGAALGLSIQTVETAKRGVDSYLNGKSDPSTNFYSLRGLLNEFSQRLTKKAQSPTENPNTVSKLKRRLAQLQTKIENFSLFPRKITSSQGT